MCNVQCASGSAKERDNNTNKATAIFVFFFLHTSNILLLVVDLFEVDDIAEHTSTTHKPNTHEKFRIFRICSKMSMVLF